MQLSLNSKVLTIMDMMRICIIGTFCDETVITKVISKSNINVVLRAVDFLNDKLKQLYLWEMIFKVLKFIYIENMFIK